MAEPLNFQPISLQQTLWDQKQLEALCAPRIMPPWEKYHANDNYGFATILKAYSGHPFDKSLPVLLTHGVYFDDQRLYDMERQCGLPGVMSYPDFRTKLWREQTDLRVIPSASPLLYAQQLMDRHFGPPMPEARSGTIYFLPHSTGHIKREIDLDQVITKLKGYCQQQEQAGNSHLLPLSVCIHWQDITHGKHRPFKKAGLPVISAGHLSDADFLFRLLHLLRLSNLALGAFPGGHVFASLVAGVPFIAWEPAKAVAEVSANFKNTLGSQRSPELSARIKHWESLFQPEQDPAVAPTPSAPITAAQQGFADMMLGREDLLDPDELFALLRSFGYPFMSEESRQATDAHFRQRYAENPEAKDCCARLAEGYAHLENWPAAFELIEQDRQLRRLTPQAELRTARWLQRMGQESEAEMLIDALYGDNPDLNDGFATLAQDAIQLQDWYQANRWLQRDSEVNQLSSRWWLEFAELSLQKNDFATAGFWISKATAIGLCSADELARVWWKMMEKGDLTGAISLAERDLKANRLTPAWKLNLAYLYAQLGKIKKATDLVDTVYREHSEVSDGFTRIGGLLAERGAWGDALALASEDKSRNRLSPRGQMLLAQLYLRYGDTELAIALVDEAYAQDLELRDGYATLGWLLDSEMQKPTRETLLLIDMDEQLGRLSARGRLLSSKYYVWGCRYDDAVRLVEQAYQADATALEGFSRIAAAAVMIGEQERALALWQRDRELNRETAQSAARYDFMQRAEWQPGDNSAYVYTVYSAVSFDRVKPYLGKLSELLSGQVYIEVPEGQRAVIQVDYPEWVVVDGRVFGIEPMPVNIPPDARRLSFRRLIDLLGHEATTN